MVDAADSDGDTLEISGNTQSVSSKYPSYGPPKGPRPEGPGPSPEIKDFLDKVANGTVTDADLQNMQTVLQQTQQQVSGNTQTADISEDTDSDGINSFLDKVAAGTVGDSDLQSMQSVLQTMQQRVNPGGTSTDTDNNAADFRSFLDKVANGTVTDTDLQNMQAKLKEMTTASGTIGRHRHPRPSSESEGTNPNSTSLDTTDADDTDLKSFLDKVAAGTVTDSDLQEMQSILLPISAVPENGFSNQTGTDSNLGSFMTQYAFSRF